MDAVRKVKFMIFSGFDQINSRKQLRLNSHVTDNDYDKSRPIIVGQIQEPITRSIQLPCVRATAFSQVALFLDL